jgi:hypothetical protein
MRDEPSGKHAVRPLTVASLGDITLFASMTDELLETPAGLEPWDPAEDDEVPWELRDEE